MRLFHISVVLSLTTHRALCEPEETYKLLDFLTGDEIYSTQLPRVWREVDPWLAAQFPQLMGNSPAMARHIASLVTSIGGKTLSFSDPIITEWVASVCAAMGLPEMIPVYEMPDDMHLHIDNIEETKAMVGDNNVTVIEIPK